MFHWALNTSLSLLILFHKQHFYKRRQAEIGKKIKQMLSNTPKLNFSYLTIIHILHLRYCSKIMGHILKTKQKSKHVFFHETTQIITMKTKMKKKNRLHRCGKNRLGLDMDTNIVNKKVSLYFFFLSRFFFTNIHESQNCRGSGRAFP